jgi:Tfp pilus assembly protein FimV
MKHTPSFLKFDLQRTLFLVLCSLASTAWAADAEPAATAAPAAPVPVVYTTKAGDNVERLLQNAMPGSPLNPALLRQALADTNPKTVTGKPGQKFKTGTIITVPDHAQLVRSTLAPFAPPSTELTARSGYSAGDPSSRRNWIRYP